jgi:hypothetical protein
MVFTQLFMTLAFIGIFLSTILVLLYFLCGGPDQKHFLNLIKGIAYLLLAVGILAGLGVIIFALFGNRDKWMPGYANNWFGWSFVLAAIGACAAGVCSTLFFTEHHVQERRMRRFKESQLRFEMEHETKT